MEENDIPIIEAKPNKTNKRLWRLPVNLPPWARWAGISSILIGLGFLLFFTQIWPRIPRYAGSYRIEIRVNPIDDTPMVLVPAGEFEMGSEDGEADERPVHTIYLDAYWIYQTEVTNRMYALCVAAQSCPSTSKDYLADAEEAADYPVVFHYHSAHGCFAILECELGFSQRFPHIKTMVWHVTSN